MRKTIRGAFWIELLISNCVSWCYQRVRLKKGHCVNTRRPELIGNTPLRQQLKISMSSAEDAGASSCAEMLSRQGSAGRDAHQSKAI